MSPSDRAEQLVCAPKSLPRSQWIAAAAKASEINPANHPPIERLMATLPGFAPTKEHIAALTSKYWHTKGVRLTVSFLDSPTAGLVKKILAHMNAWAKTANVTFVQSKSSPQVRIAREGGQEGGYWSYVGIDILSIAPREQTMNLEAFTEQTPESEFRRVVRHETGHTLGFPHEHMRRELVNLIDPAKAIAFFQSTQGWSADEVRQQVLTPIEESSLVGTAHSDPKSIMCYQIPGSITKNGKPIPGGTDIDALDFAFAAKLYPRLTRTAPRRKTAARRKK